MTAWAAVEPDLRRSLIRAGRSHSVVDQIIADLRPIFVAVEKARGRVEDELAFALLIVAADRVRRRAQYERIATRRDGSAERVSASR